MKGNNMLCAFVRGAGTPEIYVNPMKVVLVEWSGENQTLITFDNGGTATVLVEELLRVLS